MNLRDTPVAIDDAVETLLAFHRRIERHLATLCRLPVQLEVNGIDAATSATAASLVSFFGEAMPLHHADEQNDLFPLVERRLADAAERNAFRGLCQRLETDHRDIQEAWRRLRRPLEALGEGVHRRMADADVHYFRAVHVVHISAEEAGVHMLALRRFAEEDHGMLARRMLARRLLARRAVT